YIVTGNDSLVAVCWESCFPCFPVGVLDGAMPGTIVKAYPNPVQDLLHLDIPDYTTRNNPGPLRWFDVQGREVHGLVGPTGSPNTYRVDALSPGLYTVHVRTSQGVQVVRFFKN
ncbi:MAG: T9SS type A sorting domain-containing protein, partial [Bacteroidota bacterium]